MNRSVPWLSVMAHNHLRSACICLQRRINRPFESILICSVSLMWSETSVLGQDRYQAKKFGLGLDLGLVNLVVFT